MQNWLPDLFFSYGVSENKVYIYVSSILTEWEIYFALCECKF